MARRGVLIARWYAENTQTIISLKKPDKRSWSATAIGRICAPVTGTRRENTMKIDTGIPPARHAQGLC